MSLDLSEKQLLTCDRLAGNQCIGGWPYTALTGVMKNNGITVEENYKYVASNELLCRRNATWKTYKSTGSTEPIEMNGDENTLKELLMKGPVVVGVHVTQNFQFYKAGIFVDETCDADPNHAGWFLN